MQIKKIACLLLVIVCNYAIADKIVSAEQTLNWSSKIGEDFTINNTKQSFLNFEGAKLNLPSAIPLFQAKYKLVNANNVTTVLLQNIKIISISENEKEVIGKENIASDFKIEKEIIWERKQAYLFVKITPLRKKNGIIEKLLSFNIQYESSNQFISKQKSNQSYASNSVLSSGSWFKVGVTKEGICKIDFKYLKKNGIDVTSINPQNIRVYGNGGKQLPFLNSKPRIDDLVENPIVVIGENDGILDSLDYFWFYAHGPHYWEKSSDCSGYRHNLHEYSDTTYYFINYDLGAGMRMSNKPQSTNSPTNTVTSFDDLQFYENEAVNMRTSGREFYGEKFDNQLSYNFDFFVPNIELNDSVIVKASFLGISNPPATFKLSSTNVSKSVSPKLAPALGPGNTAYILDIGTNDSLCMKFLPSSSNIRLQVDFIKNTLYSSGYGYLNYIEVISRQKLKLYNNFVSFRDSRSTGANSVSKFIIENAQANTLVLNVTNPSQPIIQSGSFNNTNFEFVTENVETNDYVAFNPAANVFIEPTYFGKVENQNLHAVNDIDMIIISHSQFLGEAERLKKIHEQKDGLKSIIVTPQQIYNEFSGGSQDLAGLRMFPKMLYDRGSSSETIPKYLLLFGDASFNNRVRNTSTNTNFVPVYESAASLDLIQSYCSDDFFGLLDDEESENAASPIDIAIGRLPSKTSTPS